MYESQPDRERIDGVGIVIILLATVRILVALASGNPEHMVFGTIAGIAFGAIGGMALWLNRWEERQHTTELVPDQHHEP
ncbi:hypothetical protein HY634_00730 [Candidatus Uhrbacteria bacterium]|nr:hypothetical protein [Candidatus Uhrbacteria bacterium]